MQTGQRWIEILRKFVIGAEHTKPGHPQQNPAERRIKTVKNTTGKIMDRTGAPGYLWYLCMLYVVYLLNRVAVESLGWRTPMEKCFGETPDIFSLMQFEFYEPIFYFDQESFPNSSEKPGHFVGIAENKGDALTYWVVTEDNTVLARSVVRSAVDGEPNLRAEGSGESNKTVTSTTMDLLSEISGGSSGRIDCTDWIGMSFIKADPKGIPTKTTVIEVDDETGKVLVAYALRQKPEGWRIYDVRVDGISYVQNYRSQFDAEISARGIDAVIERLETEVPEPAEFPKSAEDAAPEAA